MTGDVAGKSDGCWVDVFERSKFRGRRRRLFGPGRLVGVRSRLPQWGVSIDSLIVGPGAYLRLYGEAEPDATALWLLPRQIAADLVELGVGDDVDSIEIADRAPAQGEVGHDAYLVALARTMTSTRRS